MTTAAHRIVDLGPFGNVSILRIGAGYRCDIATGVSVCFDVVGGKIENVDATGCIRNGDLREVVSMLQAMVQA